MCKTSVRLISCLLVLAVAGAAMGDLVGHWNFDEGSGDIANDSSGNAHHGKLLGTPAWGADKSGFGTAIVFDPNTCVGVDCGVFDPTNGSGKFSLALWAFWDGSGTYQHFFTKSNGWGAATMMFQIELWGAHSESTYTDRVGISYDPASVPFSKMPKNEWVHLAWTFDGTNARMYLNGVDEAGPKPLTIGPNVNAPVFLGVDYNGGRVFHGSLDDVRLYSHALTVDEVAALCPPSRIAQDPEPADGATGVLAPLFRWKAGYAAVMHEVYFGTTPDLGPANLVQARNPAMLYYHVPGLQPGVTYYWRVDEVEKDNVTVNQGAVWSFTAQALTAYLPDPKDGSTDVPPAPTLSWQPGQGAARHHVYFGDNLDAVVQGTAAVDKGEIEETAFVPGELDSVSTYYWRVDEVPAAGGLKAGAVWSFMTHLPVDDFESYTDEEGSRIYQTWIDGYVDKSSGSTVGHIDAPFAEQTIVHGGLQSMPLDYNNLDPPFYSEAEREFDPAADWTPGDVNTLVLNIRGQATNKADPIYLAVKDNAGHTATVVHPDPTAFRAANWLEWRIPLSSFSDAGVKLAAVKTLYLGVGSRDASAPGGAGTLYVDDIRVIKP